MKTASIVALNAMDIFYEVLEGHIRQSQGNDSVRVICPKVKIPCR